MSFPVAPTELGGAEWTPKYAGDFDHISATCARHPLGPVWREEVICVTRPHLDGLRHPMRIGVRPPA